MPRTAYPFSIFITTLLLLSINCAAAYPVTITDYYGNVTIDEQPQRIVSLMPSNTEILFAVGAGGQVVGVTDYCNYPQEVVSVEKIGGYVTLNTEKIVDLQPDMVLAYDANGDEVISTLKKLGLKVVTLDAKNMEDIIENIELVGVITGHEDQANMVTSDMNQRLAKINDATRNISADERPRVLFIVSFEPMYAAGAGSFPEDVMNIAGGSNIITAERWPVITLEEVVEKNPQIIFCTGMGERGIKFRDQILSNSVLAATDAVRDQKVYPLLEPNLVERPGPRVIMGLEELYSHISPELHTEGAYLEDGSSDSPMAGNERTSPATPGLGVLFFVLLLSFSAYLMRRN